MGVCGASADVIVARNFLRSVAAGAACYLHIVENTANNLKGIVTRDSVEALKVQSRLKELAELLGVGGTDPVNMLLHALRLGIATGLY